MVLTRLKSDSCAKTALLDDTTAPALWSHLALCLSSMTDRRTALAQFVLIMLTVPIGLARNYYVTVLLLLFLDSSHRAGLIQI